MLTAYDKDGNSIKASSRRGITGCHCKACGEPVTHRYGNKNIPHFAHLPGTDCTYEWDKDNKGPWHIHMQSLFPDEAVEVPFRDENGKIKHIADVFLKNCNTVIEFQHSEISRDNLFMRTMFHINAGRRIVWVFDESQEERKEGYLKRLIPGLYSRYHYDLSYEWAHYSRHSVIDIVKNAAQRDLLGYLSLCIYTGEEDTVHRIISQDGDFKQIALSVHDIVISGDMNFNEFFYPEYIWVPQLRPQMVETQKPSARCNYSSSRRGPKERSIKRNR